jgi:hypothetical protein
VAAVVEDLGLVEFINKRIKDEDKRRIVSLGLAVKAMIINGLGFLNKRLYMVARFFKDKPTEKIKMIYSNELEIRFYKHLY